MEKKNFIILIMSVIGGMLFSLGMCMCLIPEWGTFNQGVVLGVIGAVELLIAWIVYRKMSGKQPMKLNIKIVGKVIYGIFAALVFGVGMCCTMVWTDSVFALGIIVGIIGIAILSVAYPVYKKITKNQRDKVAEQILKLSDELTI